MKRREWLQTIGLAPWASALPLPREAKKLTVAGLETFLGEVPWRAELVDPPEMVEGGHLSLSDRPGFGVRLNGKVAKHRAA